MIDLILAILCSALISILMRVSEARISSKIFMLCMNYLMCTALAACYTDFSVFSTETAGLGRSAGLGVLGGVLFLLSFLLLQFNVEKNGVVMSSVFMKLGLLLFRERLGKWQWAAMVAIPAALVLLNL